MSYAVTLVADFFLSHEISSEFIVLSLGLDPAGGPQAHVRRDKGMAGLQLGPLTEVGSKQGQ